MLWHFGKLIVFFFTVSDEMLTIQDGRHVNVSGATEFGIYLYTSMAVMREPLNQSLKWFVHKYWLILNNWVSLWVIKSFIQPIHSKYWFIQE